MSRKILILSDLHLGKNDIWEEVGALEAIVSRIKSTYANDNPKPLIILCGDSVDHYDLSVDGTTDWYQVLTSRLQPLLPDFTILSVIGNHDSSPKEKTNEIANDIDATSGSNLSNFGSEFIEGLIKIFTLGQYDYSTRDHVGREKVNDGLAAIARLSDYDNDKISGVSFTIDGYHKYHDSMRKASIITEPNSSSLIAPTQYTFNESYWGLLKKYIQPKNPPIKMSVKGNQGINVSPKGINEAPKGDDASLTEIITHLITFDRGFEVLPVSSLDIGTTPTDPINSSDKTQITLITSEGDSILASIPNRFFLHDGHLRLSLGYVDSNEMSKITKFLNESSARYDSLKSTFQNNFIKKVKDCNLNEYFESLILQDYIPSPPRAAKICAIHHYFGYEISAINLTTAQYLLWYLRYGTSAYKSWKSSGYQNNAYDPNNKGGDRNAILELASRLALVEYKNWYPFICANPHIRGHEKDRTLNHLIKYGRSTNSNIKINADYYNNDTLNIYSRESLGGLDGVINLQPGMDGVNLSPDNNRIQMGGLLDSISHFDVAVVGHRHRLSITNLKEVLNNSSANINFTDEIADINSHLAQIAQWGTELIMRDCIDYLMYVMDEATSDSNGDNIPYKFPQTAASNTTAMGVGLSIVDWNLIRDKLIRNIVSVSVDTNPLDTDFISKNMLKWIVECPKSTEYEVKQVDIGNYDDSGGIVNSDQEIIPWYCWIELNTTPGDDIIKPVVRRFTTARTSY